MTTRSSHPPFWKTKTLEEMTHEEWESLCDGCGRCCLNKLENEDTGQVYYTSVGCKLLDNDTCRCKDYPNRQKKVDNCLQLTPESIKELHWLPPSCAYKLIERGEDLYWWHHLLSGSRETVHEAGISTRGRLTGTDDDISVDDFVHHVVKWPEQTPTRAKPAPIAMGLPSGKPKP